MEIALLQDDTGRRYSVSRSMVPRLDKQFTKDDVMSKRPVPGRQQITNLRETAF